VLSGCGYLHNYAASDIIQGKAFKLGFYPTHIVYVHSPTYLYEWHHDDTVLDPVYDPYLTSAAEKNGEIVLTLSDVGAFSSGSYRVRCTEVDMYTNNVMIEVIGNIVFYLRFVFKYFKFSFKCIKMHYFAKLTFVLSFSCVIS